MAIILRKAGSLTSIKVTAPVLPIQVPFSPEAIPAIRAAFLVEEKVEGVGADGIPPLPAPAAALKGKAIFKVLGGRPIKPTLHSSRPDGEELKIAAGLVSPPPTDQDSLNRAEWPPCSVGTRVIITNSMFPWVKHYKPGDECIVEAIPPNMSLVENPWKYKSHLLRILGPDTARKGHTLMLFRWEFEPVGERRIKTIEGRIIIQS